MLWSQISMRFPEHLFFLEQLSTLDLTPWMMHAMQLLQALARHMRINLRG